MASLSHTIKSDFRALPRNFRGVVPKLIVLIHVAMLAIVVFSLLSWEDYRVSKWGEDLSWPNWLFLLAGSFWGIPALVVSYLLLTQRLKWTLTILLVGVTVWALWLFWEEYIDGSVLGDIDLLVLPIVLATAITPILDLIILWTWKPAWRPQLAAEADKEKYYEQAWAELNADNIQQGLWAKVYASNKGDTEKTKAAYLKARVQQLSDAAELQGEQEDVERGARKEKVDELFNTGKKAFDGGTKRLDRKVKIGALVISLGLFGYYLYYKADDSPKITGSSSGNSYSTSSSDLVWCATEHSYEKQKESECRAQGGKSYSTYLNAKVEHLRLKAASTSTASSSGSEMVWCATKDWASKYTERVCKSVGGKGYSTEQQAKAEHDRLKAASTSTVSTTTDTSTEGTADLSSEGSPVPLPYNGKYNSYTSAQRPATLKINASGDSNFFVKLAYPGRKSATMTMFVRAGQTAQMKVPLGTFEFRYATGDFWYGEQRLFGQDTIYNKADRNITFEIRGNSIVGHEVTLKKVADGNFSTRRIGKDQF